LLNICNLNIYNYKFNKYTIVDFYINNIDKQENSTCVHFRQEIYLVDNLKANIFIDNNILDLEEIVIDFLTKIAFIKSCSVIISIKVKSCLYNNVVKQLVILQSTTIVFSNLQILIFIYYNYLSKQDFLFESKS